MFWVLHTILFDEDPLDHKTDIGFLLILMPLNF